jgi:Protein of unknown function (DUF2950)
MKAKSNFWKKVVGAMEEFGMARFRLTATKTYTRHIVLLAFGATILLAAAGCNKSEPAAVSGPKTFASPDEAAAAVYTAAKSGDGSALLAIFGPNAAELIISGDPVQDKAGRDKFAAQYDEMHRWGKLTNGGKVLTVGAENYPFPFPLMKNSSGQWYFDSASAKEEILARRIGGNELATIDVLNAMADAQIEYFSQTHDGNPVHQFAHKFVSDEGKHNGLYWKAGADEPESPLGPLAADASADGYGGGSKQSPQPFHGYFYRILTKQGAHAEGGAKDYVVNGNMTGGFAILAYPAEYRNSGVMTLMINRNGVVFQKDLGSNTSDIAKAINEFNPDETWNAVE